jgi:quinol monooxygenase YgiN
MRQDGRGKRPEARAVSELQGIARFKIHEGKLEEFKRLSAQCMEIVRTKDTGTLQYDIYFNDDQSECIVHERYRDSEALTEHSAHLGDIMEAILATGSVSDELLGEPSAELRATTAMSGGVVGEYQLQAAIAALHDGAERAEDTDWPQILGQYGLLARLSGNLIVELNRAVAAAMVHGPRAGLDLLAPLDKRLPGHYRLDAVRGHLLDMIGDTEAAAAHYRAAAARTTSGPERQYLVTKAAKLNKLRGSDRASELG